MGFRIAVVQPIANPIEEAENNIADAVNFIARAKSEGADFVCFPETYPGHGACRQLSIRHRVSRKLRQSMASIRSTARSSRSVTMKLRWHCEAPS